MLCCVVCFFVLQLVVSVSALCVVLCCVVLCCFVLLYVGFVLV